MIEPLAHVEGVAVMLGPRLPHLLTATPLGYRILLVDGFAYVTDGEPLPDPTRPGRAVREILAAHPSFPIAHGVAEEPAGPLPGWPKVWRLVTAGTGQETRTLRVERLVLHPYGVTIHWGGKRLLVPAASLAHAVIDAPGFHVLVPVDQMRCMLPEALN